MSYTGLKSNEWGRTEHVYSSTFPGCSPTLITIGVFCYILPGNISKTVNGDLKIMMDPHAPVGSCGFIISMTRQATDKPQTRSMPAPR